MELEIGQKVRVGDVQGIITRVEKDENGNLKNVFWRRYNSEGVLMEMIEELYIWALEIAKTE